MVCHLRNRGIAPPHPGMHMRTTAFLTLTGTGTVIQEWLNQLAAGSVAAPELLLLGAALFGLGLQTLLSHRAHAVAEHVRHETPAPPDLPAISQTA